MAITKIRGNTQILDLSIDNAQISTSANISLSKIQNGTSLIQANGSVNFTSPQVGVAPTLGSHLTTKDYVDSVATGLDVKQSVRVLAATNITLSGEQTIDGIAVVTGNRVLVTGQSTASQNGIYVVASGAWSRSADADNTPSGEVTSGMFTFVEEGTSFGSTGWVLSTTNPIVLGTTSLVFAQFSSSGNVSGGAGLVKTGLTLDVVSANSGIVVNSNDIALTLDGSTLAITGSGLKLADLSSGSVLVGNASNIATAVTLSGAVSLDNAGVVSIANNAITNVHISTGTIGLNKLVSGTAGQIIVANGSGVPTYVAMSGDTTVSTAGAVTIANNAVTTVKIANANVTLAKLVTLDSAKFIIGTTAGTNTQVTLSGDVSIDETGVATVNASTVVKVVDVVTREVPAGSVNSSNTVFTLANTPKVGTEHVYVNGLLMDEGGSNDYTISGETVTFTFAPTTGDKIRISYFK